MNFICIRKVVRWRERDNVNEWSNFKTFRKFQYIMRNQNIGLIFIPPDFPKGWQTYYYQYWKNHFYSEFQRKSKISTNNFLENKFILVEKKCILSISYNLNHKMLCFEIEIYCYMSAMTFLILCQNVAEVQKTNPSTCHMHQNIYIILAKLFKNEK